MSGTSLAADQKYKHHEEFEFEATDQRIGISGDLKMALEKQKSDKLKT
jgi:hypothetical protein